MNIILNNFYPLDYVLSIIIFLLIFFSVWKGFIQSILGLMTWIGSLVITLIFYQKFADFLSNQLNQFSFFENLGLSEIIAIVISIPVIFILTLIILRKLKNIISSDLDKATLGKIIDKFFGIIYGLFFSYFFFSIILFLANKINENFTQILLDSSQILFQINLFNEVYIFDHLPSIFENPERFTN